MDNTNLDEKTAQADVSETDTSEESQDDSSSSQETDYEALIEAERKPDPEKAKEAFRKRQEKRQEETEDTNDDGESEDKPMTRKDIDEYLARKTQMIVAEANAERITEIANELADTEGEARFIMEIHKNRIFPEGMTLRDQLSEARAIASYKRMSAKNAELARKVISKETASKDISTGTQESNTSEPKVSADLKASLTNAGFLYDNTHKTYVKTLPNGKKMFRDTKTGRSGML
jgi:hypothetical protein